MTNLELVLNMLAEATTTEISKENNPKTFADNRRIALKGVKLLAIPENKLKSKRVKKSLVDKTQKS